VLEIAWAQIHIITC